MPWKEKKGGGVRYAKQINVQNMTIFDAYCNQLFIDVQEGKYFSFVRVNVDCCWKNDDHVTTISALTNFDEF